MAIQEQFSAKWSDYMSLIEKVQVACREQMAEIADRICADYKAEVQSRIKGKITTGEAVRSIHVEQIGETSYRIGSNHDHLYFFEEGNGNRTIRPVKAKALHYVDGSFHMSSTPYAGRHCNRTVANKYR